MTAEVTGEPVDPEPEVLSYEDFMDQWVTRWRPLLLRFAARLLQQEDVPASFLDADEVVQEAWEILYRRRHVVRRPQAYIRRVADRHVRRAARKYRAHADVERHAETAGQPSRSAEQIVIDQVTRSEMHAAAAALPSNQRTAFQARFLRGLSYEEIAALYRTSAGSVSQHLHRAKVRLRGDPRWRDARRHTWATPPAEPAPPAAAAAPAQVPPTASVRPAGAPRSVGAALAGLVLIGVVWAVACVVGLVVYGAVASVAAGVSTFIDRFARPRDHANERGVGHRRRWIGSRGRRFADRIDLEPRTAVGITFLAIGAVAAWWYVIGPAMGWLWRTANPRDEFMAGVIAVLLGSVVCTAVYGVAACCGYLLYDIGSSIVDSTCARAATLYHYWQRDVEALRQPKAALAPAANEPRRPRTSGRQ